MRWEYTTCRPEHLDQTLEEFLALVNSLGAQGWELVLQSGSVYWFKRQVTDG